MRRHIRNFHGLFPPPIQHFSCLLCGENVTRKETLRDHIQNKHVKNMDKECTQCGIKYNTDAALRQHIRSKHSDVSTIHPCSPCGKTFSTSHSLKLHIKRTHVDGLPHICQLCGNCYKRKEGLLNHETDVHGLNAVQDLFCESCGKPFNSMRRLREHMRFSHETDKHPVCTVCGKSIPTRTKLKMHSNTHTGEQPYLCQNSCGKAFKSSDVLCHHKKKCQPRPQGTQ